MTEDDLQQHRRDRLKAWLDDHGGLAKVGEQRKLKPSYQSYLSQITNGYSIGGRGARTCEVRLGMPSGWLDDTAEAIGVGPAPAERPQMSSIESAVAIIATAMNSLPPDRRAELIKVFSLLTDYPDEHDYSARLVKLLEGNRAQQQGPGKPRRLA